MKKTLYFLLLLICACVLGGVLGNVASGSFAWLGYSRSFALNLDKFMHFTGSGSLISGEAAPRSVFVHGERAREEVRLKHPVLCKP